MNNYFLKVTGLDSEKYTNYMMTEYLPNNNIINKMYDEDLAYVMDKLDSKCKLVDLLEEDLKNNYHFPYKVDHFLIFHHRKNQSIHIDGTKIIRYTSLNLPLINYKDSKMIFYKTKKEVSPKINDARYFDKDDVDPIATLYGDNQWLLVNSSVPHNVMCDTNFPRTTLCVRFKTNPKFEEVAKYFGPA